jgi:hypothetical protein
LKEFAAVDGMGVKGQIDEAIDVSKASQDVSGTGVRLRWHCGESGSV